MKSLMVAGKLLILTVVLGSLVACSHTQPMEQSESIRRSASANYDPAGSIVHFVYNMGKYSYFSLTAEQKRKQNAAVYAALESDYGVVHEWYEYDARGAVKAVHGYPINSGFCRTVYSMIEVKGKQRHFEETACKSSGTQHAWRFIGK